ncbi:MAG: M36 family metallopeptidase, partial [Acidobacteriota bacterium]
MKRCFLVGMATLSGVILAGSAMASGPSNFDARINVQKRAAEVAPSALQKSAVSRLQADVRDLNVEYSTETGVVRKLSSHTGYLTGPNLTKATVLENALGYVRANLDVLGLSEHDLKNLEVTDEVHSPVSGATHLYLRQTHQGLGIYNAQLHINVNRDGRIISVNNAFVPGVALQKAAPTPRIGAADAVVRGAAHSGVVLDRAPNAATSSLVDDPSQRTLVDNSGFALNEVEAHLMWLPVGKDLRLVWNFQIETVDGHQFNDYTVDANTGDVWTSFTWMAHHSYRVYEAPTEDPEATTPLPPGDGRTLVVNPEDATASPNLWFSGSGIMDGNNVHACADQNANNGCDSGQPSCSGGVCDFPINLNSAPSNSIPAAITNLFYWNNIIHDVQYQYGFTETAGNFQENNFGRGGAGSDSVNADALDGSGNCNANFGTPPDGSNPRMQMFTCTNANPARDGDYDNGVIVHEYGHGISTRQVGGPSNSSCLGNTQQAGEGWSDWLALAYTAEPGDTGAQARGLGAYLFDTTT